PETAGKARLERRGRGHSAPPAPDLKHSLALAGCLASRGQRLQRTRAMKAVRIHEFGGAEVLKLEELPRPEPGAGEVLIEVCAASVKPVDYKIREGEVLKAE